LTRLPCASLWAGLGDGPPASGACSDAVQATPARLSLVVAQCQPERFDATLFRRFAILCPDDIARSMQKRQAEYFYGRLAARLALLEMGRADADVGRGRLREPVWPEGTLGSISHSGRYVAAVVAPAQTLLGIGVDVEVVIGSSARMAIMSKVLAVGELASLRAWAGRFSLDALLTLAFSAKESFFKAAFGVVRRYFNFDAVHVVGLEPEAGIVQLALAENLCPELPAGRIVPVRFCLVDDRVVLTVVRLCV
jgi:4'-phosphopantetheinyl transferase EntD